MHWMGRLITISIFVATQSPSTQDPVKILVDRLDLEKYKAAIKGLTQFGDRREGTERNRRAADWIEAQLKSYGCTNTERLKYDFQPAPSAPRNNTRPATASGGGRLRGVRVRTGVNTDPLKQPDVKLRELNSEPSKPGPREEVYCTKIGATHPEEMYIIGGHMDGHGWGEAANDDGSGTALVMEVARVLSSPDVQTDRSIRFILWNNEETGLNGARAYVDQRKDLQGQENPRGSGKYPEPKWLGMIQHDMMLFDHGMPRADGTVSKEQRPEADVNIEFQVNSKMAAQSQALAWAFEQANEKYATDYPAAVGSHMTNTDSGPFQDFVAAISLRENERGTQIGNGWDPQWHQPTDLYATYNDKDFRLGLNAAQTTLAALAQLTGARIGSGSAQNSGPRTHRLEATPATVAYGYYWADAKPALRIASGDIIDVDTLLTNTPAGLERAGVPQDKIQDSLKTIVQEVTGDKKGPGGHILTGPVYVEGAQPGDALEVKILSIDFPIDYGYNGCSGFVPENCDRSIASKIIPLDTARRTAEFRPGIVIPLRPFFGSMGVAPAADLGRVSSNPPGRHAGNLDNKELGVGSTLYIPVFAPGALFQIGDGHAAQGDGEVDQTAIETSLRARVQLTVRKNMKLNWPRAETSTDYISMAADPDLTTATKLAIQEMVDFLASTKGLSTHEAYQLTSVAGNVAITQLVDKPNLGVHVRMPKSIFNGPVQLTAQEDRQRVMDILHIASIPPGALGQNPNYDESIANPFPKLPDPLLLKNGQKVTTADMWWNRRRPEIVEDFEKEIYGRMPKVTPKVTWEVASTNNNGTTITKQLVGHVDNSSYPLVSVNIQATLSTPANAKGPVPVIMQLGPAPGGRGAAPADPGTVRPGSWQEQVLAKGWGYATINTGSIQADNGAGLTQGIIGLVNKGQPRKIDDWGILSAWAWGASRALDYFETDKAVDAKQIGLEGHSRWGKAILVAMAFDQRFAISYASSSGEGGAKIHRRNWGELIENVAATNEYHWMAGNFLKYAGHWDDLSVDSHELVALCAPRPVFISGGATMGDGWVDAKGMFLAAAGAGPVYKLLGKKDMGTSTFPPIETPLIDGDVAFRQHSGGHTDAPNWPTFLTFASRYISVK